MANTTYIYVETLRKGLLVFAYCNTSIPLPCFLPHLKLILSVSVINRSSKSYICCRDRNMLLQSQIPTYIHSAHTHTHTHTHTKKWDKGKRKRQIIHDMLLKANCFDFTFNWSESAPRSLHPETPQECARLNSDRLERKTALEMTNLECVYLVSTSKCYAEVHPCQNNNKKKNKKKNR